MKIETKFNFKDKVFLIQKEHEQKWKTCGFCGGTGQILGKDKKIKICPVCYGRNGEWFNKQKKWSVKRELTIGEIRVESKCEHKTDDSSMFDNYSDQTAYYKEVYMCYETGIGSGTLWPVKQLFLTEIEAQKECDRLNKEKS